MLNNDQKERIVAELFCKNLGNEYRIDNGHRECPDFKIGTGAIVIGLELTQRVQNSPRTAVEPNDKDFRSEFAKDWITDDSVHHWHASFDYKRERRSHRSEFIHFPQPDDQASFVCELKQLVRSLDTLESATSFEVRFEQLGRHVRRSPCAHIADAAAYPILAQHCSSIRLSYHPEVQFGLHRSDLQTGIVGIDKVTIKCRIADKCAKLPKYRKTLGDEVPVWLLIWNEGTNCTRQVGLNPEHNVFPSIQDALRAEYNVFAEVWFGRDLMRQGRDEPVFERIWPV